MVESELIGGVCAYWACVSSKTSLRAPEAQDEAGRGKGVTGAELEWPVPRAHRDYMIRHLDDSTQGWVRTDHGVIVINGSARVAGLGRVEVAPGAAAER